MPVAERPSGSGTYPHYPAASSSPYIQNPPLQSSQPSGTYGSLATGAASASFPLGSGSHQQPAYTAYQVVHVHHYGLCSRGGDHELQTEFTLPGVLCALFCFPCGIPCCLCMTERRCVKCGARFD
ncbi:hypothetical protein BJ085DRAFT_16638 [Dimargaris cristalligena]|uniref:Membrane protein BRI3 n=1 Tax=Dimargaris cristalligena TaxID=215637 RepID=A0A4V1J4E0_9FUNG|nr:hypothetical protein BJ085DRAFT_16638 [Dimargaris cristalligena]|eukprot:RKP35229.1 hypothetical protein BJ085DRAFT_16638 [Dimargaris cristalligena]